MSMRLAFHLDGVASMARLTFAWTDAVRDMGTSNVQTEHSIPTLVTLTVELSLPSLFPDMM